MSRLDRLRAPARTPQQDGGQITESGSASILQANCPKRRIQASIGSPGPPERGTAGRVRKIVPGRRVKRARRAFYGLCRLDLGQSHEPERARSGRLSLGCWGASASRPSPECRARWGNASLCLSHPLLPFQGAARQRSALLPPRPGGALPLVRCEGSARVDRRIEVAREKTLAKKWNYLRIGFCISFAFGYPDS